MSPTLRRISTLLLLVVGVEIWLVIGRGQYGSSPPLHVMIPLIAVASLPPVYRRVANWLERLRHPSPRARMITALAVFAAATTFLIWTGFYQDRNLFPRVHDEQMHGLQVQMLSRGRLWMPQHPAADSFETFYVLTRPVYASCYFPGTALVYVPAMWLHLPYWLMPALVAGLGAAMLYCVTTELLDGIGGLLAVLLLLSMTEFRFLALVVMSHAVMVTLGLTLLWAWLRWRATPRLAWAALIGALGGWAAITRPADALCWSIPVAIAMLWTMRDWRKDKVAKAIATILVAAAPFLAVQAVFNIGVTSKLFRTPYQMYCDLYTPQSVFGFHRFDPAATPASTLPQLIAYHEQFIHPAAQHHRVDTIWKSWIRERFPRIAAIALPSPWLLILIPAAMLATTRRRWVLLGVLPLSLALYAMFAFLLAHYIVLMTPAIIFAVLLGQEAVRGAFPRMRDWVTTVGVVVIIVFSLRAMPQFNRLIKDDVLDMPVMAFDHDLPRMVRQPALVLYRFDPSGNPHDEPVYNVDVAWPDEAPIIRAHDRSPEQNQRLFSYYAQRQPDRQVYLVDRGRVTDPGYQPQYLGRVADLTGSAR
ncbi:MAG: hypothetical protein QOE14_1410 [Humisphaera sp.]|nr:hypothetical protein [Humisphaera sp.]